MNPTRTRSIATALLAGALALSACGGSSTAVFELDSPNQAGELLADAPAGLVVLDIRTPEEFASGHIAGANNLDFYEPTFADSLDELDKDLPYFVYCNSGNRSATAIDTMKDLGFTEVYELDGGIQAWLQAGLPVQ